MHNLPAHLTRLVGRDDTVSRLADSYGAASSDHRRAGRDRQDLGRPRSRRGADPRLQHGVWLIDLAPLGDPSLVPTRCRSALGVEIRSEDPLPRLLDLLRDRRMLLVLDNCEHVIDAAAALAFAVLKERRRCRSWRPAANRCASRVSVYTASRRWRAPHTVGVTSARSQRRKHAVPGDPAVCRAHGGSVGKVELSDANAPSVADICRKLDGIALAIELAAARVDAFGVRGLASHT